MSVLGRFVPYHFQCCFNLSETARDLLLVRIPPGYDRLRLSQGFLFEKEPILTYKSITFLDDPDTGLWVVAYTERVFCVYAALRTDVYIECRLWYVPTYIIAFGRELGFAMEVSLGSRANVRELLEILDIIEAIDFSTFPEKSRFRQLRTIDYHLGRTERGSDFVYY